MTRTERLEVRALQPKLLIPVGVKTEKSDVTNQTIWIDLTPSITPILYQWQVLFLPNFSLSIVMLKNGCFCSTAVEQRSVANKLLRSFFVTAGQAVQRCCHGLENRRAEILELKSQTSQMEQAEHVEMSKTCKKHLGGNI